MLHIILLILKILGIILAIVFGMLLLAGCAIFFVPLRYSLQASALGDKESLRVTAKVTWCLHLLSAKVEYKDKKLQQKIRVLGIEIKQRERQKSKKGKKELQEKKTVWQKIKYTIRKICDMIKTYKEKKESLAEFIVDKTHVAAWKRLKSEIVGLIRYLRPKTMSVRLHFGFEDPSLTGKCAAALSMLYPFYGDNIQVTPNFHEEILEGKATVKGQIRGIRAFIVAKNLFFDKSIKKTLKDINKWKRQV